MRRALFPLLAVMPGAGAAMAEGPPADYFAGVYERVGRDGAAPPSLLNDLVRMDPVPGGLAVTVCDAGPDAPPLMVLGFEAVGDVTNLLADRRRTVEDPVWCLYGNNGDNYPLLTCSADSGAKFLLWPQPDAPCGG